MDVTGAIPTAMVNGYGYNHSYDNGGNRIDHDTILRGISDVRMEQREAECDIVKALADSSAVIAKDHADSTFRLHENIRNVADQILVSSNLTQAQVAAAAAATALATEKSTAAILAAISATELRQLQDELNETRLERNRYHGEVNFGNQIAILQSQLNSLDQIQRSTNQAINFGTGSISGQTSTSNQVR
jgi:hypothetical protein